MITTISFLLVFTLVVFIHEGGHYLAAKYSKMGVLSFSIGFGKSLFQFKRDETLFKIGWLPLGGGVEIAGLDGQTQKIPKKINYHYKSPWLKLLTVSAGPLMNFALSIVIFFIVFSFSGIPTGTSNVIEQVMAGSPAQLAGLQAGDQIIGFQGKPVQKMEPVIQQIHQSGHKKVLLEVKRNQRIWNVWVQPKTNSDQKIAMIGIRLKAGDYQKLNPFQALITSVQYVITMIVTILYSLFQLITGQLSFQSFAGPIGIAQMTGRAAQSGFAPLMNFIAVLSINLGVFNLLPIPALDGGRIVFIVYELITRKQFNQTVEQWVHAVGFIVLITLILLITLRELSPMVSGFIKTLGIF